MRRPCRRMAKGLDFPREFAGAGDRFRTDDLVLGKHTLYQLSYTRSQAFAPRVTPPSTRPTRPD